MKLQYLAVIFIIIILPILIVMAFYIRGQMKTNQLQTLYISKLNNATYDAVKAFQINTKNYSYSGVSDSKIRDIEASINTFYNSLITNLKFKKSELRTYVPAIVYTLYDGYYIYGKRYNVYPDELFRNTETNDLKETPEGNPESLKIPNDEILQNGNVNTERYQYGLKPFVYYSCHYKCDDDNDFIVNFTLDNFISIYGKVNNKYERKSGYLINLYKWTDDEKYKNAVINEDGELKECLVIKGEAEGEAEKKIYKYVFYKNRKVYYDESINFDEDSFREDFDNNNNDIRDETFFYYENGEKKFIKGQIAIDIDAKYNYYYIDINEQEDNQDVDGDGDKNKEMRVYFKLDTTTTIKDEGFYIRGGEKHKIDFTNEIKNYIATQVDRQMLPPLKNSAIKFYQEAYNFSDWVHDNLKDITENDVQIPGGAVGGVVEWLGIDTGEAKIFEMEVQDPEDRNSIFNKHRSAVIKKSIETNLIVAIDSYNSNSSSYEYRLPRLTIDDWDKITNNVCVISFLQGIPIGGKYFNNYVIVPNDKNNEFVDTDSIYLLDEDGVYHLPNCNLLIEKPDTQTKLINGYKNTSFQSQTVIYPENYYYINKPYKDISNKYYYLHAYKDGGNEIKYYTGCYYCIVNSDSKYNIYDIINRGTNEIEDPSNSSIKYDISKLRSVYLTALGRERYNLYKSSSH